MSRPGRPALFRYYAEHKSGERIAGSCVEIAGFFGYSTTHICKCLRSADEEGDGIFRPIHSPGWEIWREAVEEEREDVK